MKVNKYYGVFTNSFAKFNTKKHPPYRSQLWYSVSGYPSIVYPTFFAFSTFFYMKKYTSKKLRPNNLTGMGIEAVTYLGERT